MAKERWEVEWQEWTADALRRMADEKCGGPVFEPDHDRDEDTYTEVFPSSTKALACAKKVIKTRRTVWGHVTVQLQRYLPIEGTMTYDWEPIGEPEYVE